MAVGDPAEVVEAGGRCRVRRSSQRAQAQNCASLGDIARASLATDEGRRAAPSRDRPARRGRASPNGRCRARSEPGASAPRRASAAKATPASRSAWLTATCPASAGAGSATRRRPVVASSQASSRRSITAPLRARRDPGATSPQAKLPPTARSGCEPAEVRRPVGATSTRRPGRAAAVPGRVAAHHRGAEVGEFLGRPRRAGVVRLEPAVLRREAEGDGDIEVRQGLHLAVEPGERAGAETVGPGKTGAQVPHAQALHHLDRVVQPVILEVEPLAKAHLRRRTARRRRAPAWASRPRAAGPCGSAGSRRNPPPPCGGSSPPRSAADRRGCTSGCAAPGRSAARRSSHAPGLHLLGAEAETPTSVTHTGLSVTARISASFAGQSSIAHRFQSSGKPCTATTSTSSRTPRASRPPTNPGSIGDMPPSTRVSGVLGRDRLPRQSGSCRRTGPTRDRGPDPSATCCSARSRS